MIADTPKPLQQFSARRRRDGKYFDGWISRVKDMGERGIMIVVANWDREWKQTKYATLYLDECYNVEYWNPDIS